MTAVHLFSRRRGLLLGVFLIGHFAYTIVMTNLHPTMEVLSVVFLPEATAGDLPAGNISSTGRSTATPFEERRTTAASNDLSLPFNLHKNYTLQNCAGRDISSCPVHPATAGFFEMVYGYKKDNSRNGLGHRSYGGPLMKGVKLLTQLQAFQYTALQRWWELTQEYDIQRWSAHGGSAMAAVCHNSINPWDDDIDITAGSCDGIAKIFAKAGSVSARYPDMKTSQYSSTNWEGRLIDPDWIIMKGSSKSNWYKLKSVQQIHTIPARDLSGMDIMCMDSAISKPEQGPMKESGYEAYLKGNGPLQIVNFGPTHIKLVSNEILDNYVLSRYNKHSFCDFPVGDSEGHANKLPARASQIEVAVSNWYTSHTVRAEWLELVDKADGNNITKQVPNLDKVEIDNTIAPPQSCEIGKPGRPLKVVGFNAERGTYWSEFAEMVRTTSTLEDPDLIILNEMDIGMARSGNVHTTRKLAFELGMNYAWGLEFVELTNGNQEEQDATVGKKNALGLHGNAILSKCKMYDPIIVRDALSPKYFTNKKFKQNAMGTEKRLGGRMAMFVRTETQDVAGRHLIVGSVHKTSPTDHRMRLWEYFGFGEPPEDQPVVEGTRPSKQLGIVTSGDMESRLFCKKNGLRNLDRPQKHKTFPAQCGNNKKLGNFRGDQFCGNLPLYSEDESILPCYNDAHTETEVETQISDHSIIKIELKLTA